MAPSPSLIQSARQSSGLTRTEVAVLIDRTEQTILAYERGRSTPPSDVLGELARIYAVPVDSFYDRSTAEAV